MQLERSTEKNLQPVGHWRNIVVILFYGLGHIYSLLHNIALERILPLQKICWSKARTHIYTVGFIPDGTRLILLALEAGAAQQDVRSSPTDLLLPLETCAVVLRCSPDVWARKGVEKCTFLTSYYIRTDDDRGAKLSFLPTITSQSSTQSHAISLSGSLSPFLSLRQATFQGYSSLPLSVRFLSFPYTLSLSLPLYYIYIYISVLIRAHALLPDVPSSLPLYLFLASILSSLASADCVYSAPRYIQTLHYTSSLLTNSSSTSSLPPYIYSLCLHELMPLMMGLPK